MKNIFKSKKFLIGAIAATAAVVAIGVLIVNKSKKSEEEYRTVKVYDLDGKAEVTRKSQEPMEAYVNMMLQNEDNVATKTESWLYLKMDEDKYLLAEPDTKFRLEASGTSKDSKTKLVIEEGALVSHITKPLSDESTYEVETPNSTMAVRGTSFRVFVWYDENGKSHTILQVFEGNVVTTLIYPDGKKGVETRSFGAGSTASIWGSSETSDYDELLNEIDYYSLDIETLEFLKIAIPELAKYNITLPDVDEIIRIKQTYFDVIFKAGEEEFGRQSILFDHYATEPKLRPSLKGHWDYSFDQAIREETEIHWIEE